MGTTPTASGHGPDPSTIPLAWSGNARDPLAPGPSIEDGRTQLEGLSRRLAADHPDASPWSSSAATGR